MLEYLGDNYKQNQVAPALCSTEANVLHIGVLKFYFCNKEVLRMKCSERWMSAACDHLVPAFIQISHHFHDRTYSKKECLIWMLMIQKFYDQTKPCPHLL